MTGLRVFSQLCGGGSARPLVTFFPRDQPDEPPISFFWNLTGQRVSSPNSPHFADHMEAFANNELLDTHFTDFESAKKSKQSSCY